VDLFKAYIYYCTPHTTGRHELGWAYYDYDSIGGAYGWASAAAFNERNTLVWNNNTPFEELWYEMW
jgi:hypothetical protein